MLAFSVLVKVVLQHALVTEVDAIPVIDRGKEHFATCYLDAFGAVDKSAGTLFKQLFAVVGGECLGLEIRAPQTGAVDDIMNTSVLPDRTQNPVFDIIERQCVVINGEQLFVPGTKAEKAA